MGKVCILLVLFGLCLTGCAPLQVNLSGSEYQPALSATATPKRVASITVINRAADAPLQNHPFSDSLIPIKTAVSTQSTVESDIKLLLAETLNVGGDADKSLFITIRKADAYWTMSVADRIPFVGLATAARDRDFIMHVVLSIEVRKDGSVVANYPVDREVKIIGKATTRDAIAESYQRLIAQYRADVLGDIQRNFIDKSL
jgi:hypothetical protein